jgi:hypothetical protein
VKQVSSPNINVLALHDTHVGFEPNGAAADLPIFTDFLHHA